ncbi:GerMN domain-containing protein [Desulfitobacterium metallireducens]|uniref:Sporulation/spore germination protein n=1 Tax=Desulfitobacterium metallireducens DSM 15288 TaxID=871968 RepID=W0EAD5_9FIRM|nr:GerMN domain-containing protein [Desulfitobacterium metallireducens]AHF07830.1 sporulation/spore germination protein [Desulfitobacterium metallireducens DSM 15288]
MFLRKTRPLALILIVVLVMMLGVTGCGTSNLQTQATATPTPNETNAVANSSSANNTPTPNSTTAQATPVTLYFPTPDASGLVAVEKTVNVSNGEVIKAMFNEFNNPPTGLERVLPKGTELLDASIKDGVATLNLSKEFKSNFEGGGTGEQMILYSIVNSLTTLPNVQSVQFLLNGEKTIAILGEMDTSGPLKRDESLITKQ